MRRVMIIVFAMMGIAPAGLAQSTVIDVGDRRELFVDGTLIDTLDGAGLKLHEPVNQGSVVEFDRPYEGKFSGYVTSIHDREAGLFRLYYRGLPEAGGDYTANEVTCYAESDDGIVWRKPDLGLIEFEGSTDNNIILAGQEPFSHNFSPFLDTRPGCPEGERYKALAGSHTTGLHVFVSPDGLSWTKRDDEPVITEGAFDSQNVAFWSAAENTYVSYFRTWSESKWGGFRSVSRSTSADFAAWSEPVAMTFGDTPMEHLYTNQTHPYWRAPHIYIAIPMRFMPGRRVLTAEEAGSLGVHVDPENPNRGYASDCAEAVFMTSRGGSAYDRTFMEAYIRPGTDLGNWASRAGMTALGVVQTGPAELSLYKQAHYAQPSAHLLRYTLRLDGFSSLNGPYEGGTMVTKPLRLEGGRLTVNFATSAAGEIRISLLDGAGEPIEGYGPEDADPLIGDRIDHAVSWNGKTALPDGMPVRLRVDLKDADLYSFQATDEP